MIVNRKIIESWQPRVRRAGKDLGELAKAADVNPGTLTNALNGRDVLFSNVCKIESVITEQWGQPYEE